MMETPLYPQPPGSQSAHRPSSQGPRGKSLLHASEMSIASLLDQHGDSIVLNGESGSEMGAKFSIREYPSPADFFSVDILIAATGQTWCIFVPIDAVVAHLLHCWDSLPKYDRRKLLGEWIVKFTDMEFQDGRIIGSQFDQYAFTSMCEKELRRLLHVMAVRVQALIRGVLSREAHKKAQAPPIQYDRSFYTTNAIAKMRPKIPYPKPLPEESGTIHDHSVHNKVTGNRVGTGFTSLRDTSPTKGGPHIRKGSPDKRNISTAPLHHQRDGGNRFGIRSDGPGHILLGHEWRETLDAPRSVTAGNSPRSRPKRQYPTVRDGVGNMHLRRPHGPPPQWPTKTSPRHRSARGHYNEHHKKLRNGSKITASAGHHMHPKHPSHVQEKMQDVMALYVSAPGPYQHRNFGCIDTSVGSYINQVYKELQAHKAFDQDGDGEEASSHMLDIHGGRHADISMEYVELFDTRQERDINSLRTTPSEAVRENSSHSPISGHGYAHEHRQVHAHGQGHTKGQRGPGSAGIIAGNMFGSMRYVDPLEDKSTMTENFPPHGNPGLYSEANSYHTTRVEDGSASHGFGGIVEGDDGDRQHVMVGSSALSEENSVHEGSSAPPPQTYIFHDSDVLDSNDPSLWNGSVTDNIYWPTEVSLASGWRKGGLGGASKTSRIGDDKGMSDSSPIVSAAMRSAVGTEDSNYLHPGDYKFLVDYRDASQRKGWHCILRFLTLYAHKFRQLNKRKILIRDMHMLVDESDIRESMQLSIQTGDVELAVLTIQRIQSIILSHMKGRTAILSSFNPTSLSNLSLIVEMVHAFVSISDIATVAIDVLRKLSSISNIGDLPEVIGSSGALNLVVTLWSRYNGSSTSDSARTIMLMKVSTKLTEESNRNRLRLFSVSNCNSLGKLILKYATNNQELLERFLRLLCKTGAHDDKVMENYCRSQLYCSILYGVSTYIHHRSVFHILCKAVTALCSTGHIATQTYFGSSTLCLMYLEMLKNNTHDPYTYRCAVSIIISMCARHLQNMANLADCQLPQFLMSVLSDDAIDGEVLRCSLSLLFHLSSHEPLKDGLIAMGLDALLNDVGMRYDIKRTLGSLKKHSSYGSPSASPEERITSTSGDGAIAISRPSEAAVAAERTKSASTPSYQESPTKRQLDDNVSQATLQEMAQLHIENSPLTVFSSTKPRARSLDNVLNATSTVKNLFAQTISSGKNGDDTAQTIVCNTAVGQRTESPVDTQHATTIPTVAVPPTPIPAIIPRSPDYNDDSQSEKKQSVDQTLMRVSDTVTAVDTIIKTSPFSPLGDLEDAHEGRPDIAQVTKNMPLNELQQKSPPATAVVGHVIRNASDNVLAKVANHDTSQDETLADAVDVTYPPSLVIGGCNDDDTGDTSNTHCPRHHDSSPNDECVVITSTNGEDCGGVISPENGTPLNVISSPECVDGDYILDCLVRAVDLGSDGLAVKTLKSINHVIEKSKISAISLCTTSELDLLKEIVQNPTVLLRVLNAFLHATSVQNIGIWVLRNMVYDNEEHIRALVDAGVCDTLYSTLQEHVYNDEIFTQTIDYLSYMAFKSTSFCRAVGSTGYCNILSSAMSRIVVSKTNLMCACCMLTRILALEHVDNLCRSGVAGLVVKFLIANKHEQKIVHLCSETILSLTETNSPTALSLIASHKHLRLYVHIIKVNHSVPYIVNVMSNVVVMLSAHKGSYNFAAETEKSGMVIDLINVLRHSLMSGNEASVYILHTSLLLMVHVLCHVDSVAKLLKTGGGEDILRGLLSYGHIDHDRAEAIRDVALAGLQHMLTHQSRDSRSGVYGGRPGVSVEVTLDAEKIYSYSAQYDHPLSALDCIDYSVDHGPYPDQPEIVMPEVRSPVPIAPSNPTSSPLNGERDISSSNQQHNHTEELPVDVIGDEYSVNIFSAEAEAPASSLSPMKQESENESVLRFDDADSPFSQLRNSLSLSPQSSSKPKQEGFENESEPKVMQTGAGHQRRGSDERSVESRQEVSRTATPAEGLEPSSGGTGSGPYSADGDDDDDYDDDDAFTDEPVSTLPAWRATSRIRQNLSGNSLLRVLQSSSTVEFILEQLQRAVDTKDRVLTLNVLNRIVQILVAHAKDTSTSDQNHPLISALIQRQSLLIDSSMHMSQDKDVQMARAAVLHRLPLAPQDMERFVSEGMLDTIYSVLQIHQENPDTFVSWIKFATRLIKHSGVNRIAAGKDHGCQTINMIFHGVLNDKKMALCTLTYVYAMCDDCVKNQGLFARTGVGSTVLKFLLEHKKDGDVVKKCIKVVDSLCAGNIELNQKVLASQRHLRLYIKIIRSNASDTIAVQAICGLLITICGGTSQYVHSELSSGCEKIVADMISLLLDVTGSTKYDDGAVQALLAVLSHWTHSVRILKSALVQSDKFVEALEQLSAPRWNPITVNIAIELVKYYEIYK